MAPEAYGLTTVGDRWPCQCSERKGIRGQFLTLHSGGTRRLVEECKVKNGPPSVVSLKCLDIVGRLGYAAGL